jgi:hypothetical protein
LCHQSVFFKGYGAPIRSNSVFNQIMVHHFLWRNVIPPVGLKKTWGINWSLWGKMLGALSQYRAQAFLRRMIQSLAEMGEQPWWGGRLRPHTTIKNIFHMSSFRKKNSWLMWAALALKKYGGLSYIVSGNPKHQPLVLDFPNRF